MLFLVLMAACSAPENGPTANSNAAPVNANAPSVTAQPATPLVNAAPPVATTPAPAAQPAPATTPAAAANGPKLVIVSQDKELDFGKQAKGKTLIRPIRIKNGGTAALNIESVSPS